MNLHLENFNKLETRDRWTATVFTSSSSVVQIILTNSARDAGHFPTPRFGHFPTPKHGHFSTQLRKIKHGILTAAKILRNVAEEKGCWLFWDSYTHLGAHTIFYIYMLFIF
jgi:hypothetical protein